VRSAGGQRSRAGGQYRRAYRRAILAGAQHRWAVQTYKQTGKAGKWCRRAEHSVGTHSRCPAVSRVTADGRLSQGRQAGVRLPWLLGVPCLRSGCITSTLMIVHAGYPSSSAPTLVPGHCWQVLDPCCAASPALAAWHLPLSLAALKKCIQLQQPDGQTRQTQPTAIRQQSSKPASCPACPCNTEESTYCWLSSTAHAPAIQDTPPYAPHLILRSEHLKLTIRPCPNVPGMNTISVGGHRV
jgi:hypothetical protein